MSNTPSNILYVVSVNPDYTDYNLDSILRIYNTFNNCVVLMPDLYNKIITLSVENHSLTVMGLRFNNNTIQIEVGAAGILSYSGLIGLPTTFYYQNNHSVDGEQGPPGPSGEVAIGTTTTGAPGSNALVTNTGTPTAGIFNFTIPGSFPANNGSSPTIRVGPTSALPYGSPPQVNNTGTTTDAIFEFGIPAGRPATIAVGTVTNLPSTAVPYVTNVGPDESTGIFNFGLVSGTSAPDPKFITITADTSLDFPDLVGVTNIQCRNDLHLKLIVPNGLDRDLLQNIYIYNNNSINGYIMTLQVGYPTNNYYVDIPYRKCGILVYTPRSRTVFFLINSDSTTPIPPPKPLTYCFLNFAATSSVNGGTPQIQSQSLNGTISATMSTRQNNIILTIASNQLHSTTKYMLTWSTGPTFNGNATVDDGFTPVITSSINSTILTLYSGPTYRADRLNSAESKYQNQGVMNFFFVPLDITLSTIYNFSFYNVTKQTTYYDQYTSSSLITIFEYN